jgi:hypothetical protein
LLSRPALKEDHILDSGRPDSGAPVEAAADVEEQACIERH